MTPSRETGAVDVRDHPTKGAKEDGVTKAARWCALQIDKGGDTLRFGPS